MTRRRTETSPDDQDVQQHEFRECRGPHIVENLAPHCEVCDHGPDHPAHPRKGE